MLFDFSPTNRFVDSPFCAVSQTTKNKSTDLLVKQKWAIIAKLNLYTNENTRRVDSNGLHTVASTFKVSRTTVGRFKQECWEQVDSGKLYPDMHSEKKERLGV